MPKHLTQQKGSSRWYAVLEIPEKLRKHFDHRRRFKQTLGTDSLAEARVLVLPVIARWKAEIEEARTGKPANRGTLRKYLEWQKDYQNASEEERETLDFVLSDVADNLRYHDPNGAEEMYRIVTGGAFPFGHFVDGWIDTLPDTEKTKDMKRSVVIEFAKSFEFSHQVNRQAIREWAHKLQFNGDAGKRQAKKTVAKKLSFLSGYFKFLQGAGHIKGDDEPFKKVIESSKRGRAKAGANGGWIPLTNEEVVATLDAAIGKGEHSLAALIWLGAWTGCRIDELCSLKVNDVAEDRFMVINAKTEAGNREVPIHGALADAINELKDSSYDGYIIGGLTFNKYGDRSNAVGKKFGRLAKELRLGERRVFHSIRKTVTTQLENAFVPDGLIAEIIGHEKDSFTTRVYSAGFTFENKRKAIEHLSYPLKGEYHFCNRRG